MWLGLALAVLGLFALPETVEEQAEVDASAESSRHRPGVGRLSSWFGPGVATGLTARQYGDPEIGPTDGRLAAATVLAALQGRVAGYAERRAGRSRAKLMLTPELMVVGEIGGTVAWRDAIAEQRALAGRRGFAIGISGVTSLGVAWATSGRVGVYGRVSVGQRFSARTNANLEGPYLIAAVGPSFGLRVAVHRVFTLLAGGGVDGQAGVQRFDDRGRLIAQLAPIAEFAIYAQPKDDVYFGFVARGDLTVLGRRHGGQRMHGRGSVEFGWRLPRRSEAKKLPRYAAMLLVYDGTRIDAAPDHPQFDPVGERRVSHQLLLAAGISF
jgi:hypothetical protein